MKPTVGRIVHYKGEEGECLAAVVTRVIDFEDVDLQVFRPDRVEPHGSVCQGERQGRWHWPEREES